MADELADEKHGGEGATNSRFYQQQAGLGYVESKHKVSSNDNLMMFNACLGS